MENQCNRAFSPLEWLPDAVVVDNGEYPSHPFPLKRLAEAPYIACCDGAADTYLAAGRLPDIIIGDGDSISAANRGKYASILHRIAEQETNDQTKAVSFLTSIGKKNILIVGGTGKREDHTIGNVSLLIEYLRKGWLVLMATDHGIFVPCSGTVTLKSYRGQQISIFNFSARHFHSENLQYPFTELSIWWQGTLNESTADEVTIGGDGDFLVFMQY
jgi:thiamine pyrophosphokinase